VVRNNCLKLAVGDDPVLGHNVPDRDIVRRELERDTTRLSGVDVETLKVAEQAGRLTRSSWEHNVKLGNVAAEHLTSVLNVG
jgi:hypothetical protein